MATQSIQIVIDITGEAAGAPGVARTFPYVKLSTSPTVTLKLEDTTGVNEFLWEFVSTPEGSSTALSDASAAEPTFDPDVDGTYLVQCTVNGGETYDRNGLAFTSLQRQMRKPGAGETWEFDGTEGWKAAGSRLFDVADGLTWETIGALNEEFTTTDIEVALGAFTFDSRVPPEDMRATLRWIGEATDPATTSIATVRLYDIGTPSTPATPRLVGHSDIDTASDNGVTKVVDLPLVGVADPGVDVRELELEERVYTLTGWLDSSAGGESLGVYKISVIVEEDPGGVIYPRHVPVPDLFLWNPTDFSVVENQDGTFSSTYDWREPALQNPRYVSLTGSDGGTGVDWANAWAGIDYAIDQHIADPTIDGIYVEGGEYRLPNRWDNALITENLAIIGVGGMVVTSSRPSTDLTFAPNGTYPDVHEATSGTTVAQVTDNGVVTLQGFGTRLVERASLAEVNANPGSWYYTGTTLYVRTSDSRAPDSDVVTSLSVSNARINAPGKRVYIKNVHFLGSGSSSSNLNVEAVGELVMVNVWLTHSRAGNSLDCDNADHTRFYNCITAEGWSDGFNYHNIPGTTYSLEELCKSYNCGKDAGVYTNNGSTTHDGNYIIRVQGTYLGSHGPVVIDVNVGTQSWCLGCQALDSVGVLANRDVGFYTETIMFLHRCTASGNTADLYADTGAKIYRTSDCSYNTTGGSGDIEEYDPYPMAA